MFISFPVLLFSLLIFTAIGFYTLFERNILSLSQNRIGPNNTSMKGLLQPLIDGVKLILNEMVFQKNYSTYFLIGPTLIFVIILSLLASSGELLFAMSGVSFLFYLTMFSLTVFSTLLSGWSSFSNYALLGSIRSAAQTVSYEVVSSFLILCAFLLISSNVVLDIPLSSVFISFPLLGSLLFVFALLETNRAPFDYSEGESELISGFNLEYSSVGFVFLFLGEYGMIIFFSLFISFLVFPTGWIFPPLLFLYLFILCRSSFPRFRYDKSITLIWTRMLPVVIAIFILICFLCPWNFALWEQ